MSDLKMVYQYFTLEQWKTMAIAIFSAKNMSIAEKKAILTKFPSAAISDLPI